MPSLTKAGWILVPPSSVPNPEPSISRSAAQRRHSEHDPDAACVGLQPEVLGVLLQMSCSERRRCHCITVEEGVARSVSRVLPDAPQPAQDCSAIDFCQSSEFRCRAAGDITLSMPTQKGTVTQLWTCALLTRLLRFSPVHACRNPPLSNHVSPDSAQSCLPQNNFIQRPRPNGPVRRLRNPSTISFTISFNVCVDSMHQGWMRLSIVSKSGLR